MADGKFVPMDGDEVRRLRKAKGWSVARLAEVADVSPGTIESIEKGGHQCQPDVAGRIMAALKGTVRDVSGTYVMEGHDLEIDGRFKYAYGPKPLGGQVRIKQSGSELKADGTLHDGDTFNFGGEIDGDFVRGTYVVNNPRERGCGSLFLKYVRDGKSLTGYYLGRDTNHLTDIVFGWMTLTLSGDSKSATRSK